MTNNISFGQSYHFLNKQTGIFCAYCGGLTLKDNEVRKLHNKLLSLKGIGIAEVLRPFCDYCKCSEQKGLREIIEISSIPEFSNKSFKELTLMMKTPNMYNENSLQTLWNIMNGMIFSVDHIQPRAMNGVSAQFNYLPMHRCCNTDRGCRSYGELLVLKPDFLEHIKKSLQQLRELKFKNPSCLPDRYIDEAKARIISQGISENLLV